MKFSFKLPDSIEEYISRFSWDIGVDLGSSNTLIYLKERGVVINEPTMLARQKKKKWTGLSAPSSISTLPLAYGMKAKEILNREPARIEVISPLKNGIISDLEAAESLIAYYLKLVYEIPSKNPKVFKPRVIVGVPTSINQVQKRAVKTIFEASGVREVILVEEAVLAAIGVGLPMDKSTGLMVVDMGGGITEISVVSMGGIVVCDGIKIAGNDLDQSIIKYIRMKYGLLIGQNTAEKLKIELGCLDADNKEKKISIARGRDLETGLPRSIKMTESEIREAITMEISKIVKAVIKVLDQTPPELMEDILKRGIVLVGEGSKLDGLDKMIEKETKIITRVAEDPGMCIIKGCSALIEDRKLFNQIKIVSGL